MSFNEGFTVGVFLAQLKEDLMGQFEDLQTAAAQLKVDFDEAVVRIETKLTAAGLPDRDLTPITAELTTLSERADALVADALVVVPPVEPPVEPPLP